MSVGVRGLYPIDEAHKFDDLSQLEGATRVPTPTKVDYEDSQCRWKWEKKR